MVVQPLTHAALAQALRDALLAQPWLEVRDSRRNGQPVTHLPAIDLAVAAFPSGKPPVWANLLLSREHPQTLRAEIPPNGGAVRNIAFLADPTDATGTSIAWQPNADWSGIAFQPLWGDGPQRFVAPYPASLIKLMVLVGVARLVDAGQAEWDEVWPHAGERHSVAQWAEPMITLSSNEATTALVALLHARGAIRRDAGGEQHNALHDLFAQLGLPTLRLADTQADGGWFNRGGAGVGHLQMTAWDTVRLLWLLAGTDAAPWLPGEAPRVLGDDSRARVWTWLAGQTHNTILSTGALRHVPGWVPGIPCRFEHKTGNTESYASDAGRVRCDNGLRYLIAILTTQGSHTQSHPDQPTTWLVPQVGAAVHAWLEAHRA
ncbi:MAG: serine hydrolase [Burkholderiales bacterium]|nr:serine hydrolase [Burkholderiales bacterium]